MNAKHTPTPWRLTNWTSDGRPEITDGRHILAMASREDDARLIVRAVNSHDALVKTLKEAEDYLQSDDKGRQWRDEVLEKVQKAIAQAEGDDHVRS